MFQESWEVQGISVCCARIFRNVSKSRPVAPVELCGALWHCWRGDSWCYQCCQAELLSTGNDGLRNQLEFDARQFVALLQILDLNELEQRIQQYSTFFRQCGPTSRVCTEDPWVAISGCSLRVSHVFLLRMFLSALSLLIDQGAVRIWRDSSLSFRSLASIILPPNTKPPSPNNKHLRYIVFFTKAS